MLERSMASRELPPRCGLVLLAVAALCVDAVRVTADEPPVRLAPIEATQSVGGRIDPLRPVRLTTAERARLYEQAARDAEPLERQALQLRRLAQLLQPTVVHIDARKPLARPRGGKTSEEEAGSGVIVEIAGRTVVLTNRHVVHRAPLDDIRIRLDDGRELLPRRLWSDAATDLAVLEIEADVDVARLSENDTVLVGDTVLAIGSPFGLARSITLGIVSAKGRRDLELGDGAVQFQDFIQTDAAINPGNSGGPLVNLRGEVIGINTAIASNSGGSEGIGFAIPIAMVRFVAGQLVSNGVVNRGFLGVSLDREFSHTEAHGLGMVRPVGARVEAVTAGAPAQQAGIRSNDVIIEFDGRPVEDDDHLMSLVSMTPVDSVVRVALFRDRGRTEVRLTVAKRADFEP
jgi:serine protease Do